MLPKCLILLLFLSYIDAQYPYNYASQSCPHLQLEHGRVRLRRTKLVKFTCSPRYELVGNRYATCRNGVWDVPTPVCVRPGCPELPVPANSIQIKAHHEAWVVTFCLPGFKLTGSSAIFCDGNKWNTTSPKCVDTTVKVSLSCDFENTSLCGWTQDELHDFDWKRLNKKTPSSFLQTGPAFDHTYGKGYPGYYMYIESTSKLENDTARLLSPIYDVSLAKNGCFSFFYHMYGKGTGGLKIYQKPDSLKLYEMLNMTDTNKDKYILFEQWGNLGDEWFNAVPQLKDFEDSFQIVIEGIRGSSFTSDIAIDDVAILQGDNCTIARNAATTPAPAYAETCANRCFPASGAEPVDGCWCSISCLRNGRCCPDYFELCILFNGTDSDDYEFDEKATSAELPQKQKLVGEITTTISTTSTTTEPPTTTSLTTTTTPKPIPTTPKPTTKKVVMTTKQVVTTTKQLSTPAPTPSTTIKQTVKTTRVTTPTTLKKTTEQPTTTGKAITTKRVDPTTNKASTYVTPKPVTTKVITVVTNPAVVTTTRDYHGDEKKRQDEINLQKLVTDKPVNSKSSTSGKWKSAVITVVILALLSCLIYLAVASRGARGRAAIERLRGRTRHDPEVRYLNSNDDEDL